MGYATYDPARPNEPWTFHAITPKNGTYKRTRTASAWATSTATAGSTSSRPTAGGSSPPTRSRANLDLHPFKFAEAGAQMFVYDVDGDGLNDMITSWHCHEYGLVWYKQMRDDRAKSPGSST